MCLFVVGCLPVREPRLANENTRRKTRAYPTGLGKLMSAGDSQLVPGFLNHMGFCALLLIPECRLRQLRSARIPVGKRNYLWRTTGVPFWVLPSSFRQNQPEPGSVNHFEFRCELSLEFGITGDGGAGNCLAPWVCRAIIGPAHPS